MRQYIDIDVNETFNVPITLSVQNIVDFIKECSDNERLDIIMALKQSGISTRPKPSSVLLMDSMKIEFFMENFEKITLDDLKSIIK